MIIKPEIYQGIRTNVIEKDEMIYRIENTLSYVSNILSNSLGPYGSTTILSDKFNINNSVTKDGYTILNHIKIDGAIESIILDYLKKISKSIVSEVGDGSTSAIIVASELYSKIINFINNHPDVPVRSIINDIKLIQDFIIDKIKEKAIQITEDNKNVIKDIALISTNNDINASNMIYEIYNKIGKDGFIDIEMSPTSNDYYEIINGVGFYRGNTNTLFSNQPDKLSIKFNNGYVFMSNQILSEEDIPFLSNLLGSICLKNNKSLVIISKGYDYTVKNFFQINKLKSKDALDFVYLDYNIINSFENGSFEDMAIFLGGKVFDKSIEDMESYQDNNDLFFSDILEFLGEFKSVNITDRETNFMIDDNDDNNEVINERINFINEEIIKMKKDESYIDRTSQIHDLQMRIAKLKKNCCKLYIGGDSDIEKETRKYLIEDAVYSIKSAMKYGYIYGGNLVIPITIVNNINNIINYIKNNNSKNNDDLLNELLSIVYDSFIKSYYNVLSNYYGYNKQVNEIINQSINDEKIMDLRNNEFINLSKSTIVNSIMTDITILKSAISIITLLATSNQFFSTAPLDHNYMYKDNI